MRSGKDISLYIQNQPFTPQIRVRHDSEVQGGGKAAVRGEEVKPSNMWEGERYDYCF